MNINYLQNTKANINYLVTTGLAVSCLYIYLLSISSGHGTKLCPHLASETTGIRGQYGIY